MSSKIEIGRIGKIVKGDDVGCFIKIQDDSENTGGFLILQSESEDFSTGSDDWVEDAKGLEESLEESEWAVNWL